MHKLAFILIIMVMLSGCIPVRQHKWECLSGAKTEYLVPSNSKIPYNKQWVYGSWKPASVVGNVDVSKQLQTCKVNTRLVNKTVDGSWVYACDPKFSWNNPPIFKTDAPKPTPGSTIPPASNDTVYPSIYRQFFGVEKISSGTLYVSVAGSVDVYMDPPIGTALINNPKTMSRYYLGRSDSLNEVAISINKIYPGTHCLYFVHRANNNIAFFGLKYNLDVAQTVSQTSDCLWPVTAGGCRCTVSNGSTEFLEAENDWNNKNDPRYPNGMTPAGTPFGGEWIYGVWSPVSVIPYAAADNYWGAAVGGEPWNKQMDQGACWITHRPHFIPKDPTWGREMSWTNVPTGYTSIYRHTFSVDKESAANLYIFTNDIVDVYYDPVEPEPARWFANTLIEWQGSSPLPMNHPWQDQPSYYYVGRADKQTRGMKIDLSNLITPGTHTLYFVHRNSSEIKPIPSKDYYGLLFTLCMKEDCDCPGSAKPKK